MVQESTHTRLFLTEEAQSYLSAGASPEKAVLDAVPQDGAPMDALRQHLPQIWAIGFKKAMEKKWVKVAKGASGSTVSRIAEAPEDTCLQQLQRIAAGDSVSDGEAAELKKRKLAKLETWKTYRLTKGPHFALERVKPATDLTLEMLQSGAWRTKQFKDYNFQAHTCSHSRCLLCWSHLGAHACPGKTRC